MAETIMAQLMTIHPQNPQQRLIRQAAEAVRRGAVAVYPTDSCYALGCLPGNKEAMERMLAIRKIDPKHHLTLLCRDLGQIGVYARMDNAMFRLIKSATPGSYTFILPASKEVPARTLHPKRKTIGMRVPDHAVAQALLEELGGPLLSCTLILPGEENPPAEIGEVRDVLDHAVDVIIDSGYCGTEPTTVVDLTDGVTLVRRGRGDTAVLGLD